MINLICLSSTHTTITTKSRQPCPAQDGSGVILLFAQQLIFMLSELCLIQSSGSQPCIASTLSTSLLYSQNLLFLVYRKVGYGSPQSGCVIQTPGRDRQKSGSSSSVVVIPSVALYQCMFARSNIILFITNSISSCARTFPSVRSAFAFLLQARHT